MKKKTKKREINWTYCISWRGESSWEGLVDLVSHYYKVGYDARVWSVERGGWRAGSLRLGLGFGLDLGM